MMHSIQTEGGAEHVRENNLRPVRDVLSNACLPGGDGHAVFSALRKSRKPLTAAQPLCLRPGAFQKAPVFVLRKNNNDEEIKENEK